MKKFIVLLIATFTVSISISQTVDSVKIGAGYANQVWYSLTNGAEKTESLDNWDLAFDLDGFGYSIMTNDAAGIEVYKYPNGDTANFKTLDTAGLHGWTQEHNTDTNWLFTSLNRSQTHPNYGWGVYNSTTHYVVGKYIYVIKLLNGMYQKLWIVNMGGGKYVIRHASLDNMMDMTHEIKKADYPDKHFAYFSLQNHSALDREPKLKEWDLLFTKYFEEASDRTSTGVLQNKNVKVAKVYPVNDVNADVDFTKQNFDKHINTIGRSWKKINFSTFEWDIEDSLVYLVKPQSGGIWKMIFTGFGGSSNGKYEFTKELIVTKDSLDIYNQNSSIEFTPNLDGKWSLYPNPVEQQLQIVFDNETNLNTTIEIYDLLANLVKSKTLNNAGLISNSVNVTDLKSGIYLAKFSVGATSSTKKFIVK